MTFFLIFVAASLTASALVVSASVVSSRISRSEPWEEYYEYESELEQETILQPAPQPFS